MKRIPTVFERDPDDRTRVTDDVRAGCEWVLNGEGNCYELGLFHPGHNLAPYRISRTFTGIRDALVSYAVKGFIFVHPDGRTAQIKSSDFGIKNQ